MGQEATCRPSRAASAASRSPDGADDVVGLWRCGSDEKTSPTPETLAESPPPCRQPPPRATCAETGDGMPPSPLPPPPPAPPAPASKGPSSSEFMHGDEPIP